MQQVADYITEEKKQELETELADLRGPRRKEILEALQYAKSLGDLSENAEYHQAREDQGKLEVRIQKIEQILQSAQVIQSKGGNIIQVGSKVVVQKSGMTEEKIYVIRDIRIKKINLLRKAGMDPYPADSKREISLKDAVDSFDNLEKNRKEKWIAGRIMSIRGQGAIIFFTLYDGTGSFQGVLKKDVLGAEKLDFWNEVVDIGDFVEVRGIFFKTNRGEKTIEAKDWRMLSKSLRPLPEKWHGLTDSEERYRKRYLDILMNPELKELFEKKAKFWDVTREFMKQKGFLEVETPTLETTTGGAEATPFKTHHNDYDMDVYLRISVGELWQKRLMAGGFPKTFEIGRI